MLVTLFKNGCLRSIFSPGLLPTVLPLQAGGDSGREGRAYVMA